MSAKVLLLDTLRNQERYPDLRFPYWFTDLLLTMFGKRPANIDPAEM